MVLLLAVGRAVDAKDLRGVAALRHDEGLVDGGADIVRVKEARQPAQLRKDNARLRRDDLRLADGARSSLGLLGGELELDDHIVQRKLERRGNIALVDGSILFKIREVLGRDLDLDLFNVLGGAAALEAALKI